MSRSYFGIAAALIILIMAASGVVAQNVTLFDQLLSEYETIRLALLHDSTEGVQESALSMVRHVDEYDPESDTPAAAINSENSDKFRVWIHDFRESADMLSHADALASSRDAFGKLSRAMVAYRQLTESPKSVVVYCSMAEKVWLQPKGEIGNPYYGQSMAGCGEIISE